MEKKETEQDVVPKKNKAPDLTDYGSDAWIRGMIMAPAHPSRYGFGNGKNNEMTPFRNTEGPGADILLKEFSELQKKNGAKSDVPPTPLSDSDRELIVRWLTHDYRAVFGGKTISGPP
jgi:hypothetical protein